MPFASAARDGVEVGKGVVTLIREVLVIALIVFAISSPARVVKIMTSLGATDWSVLGVKGNFAQATNVDNTVQQLQETVAELETQLNTLQQKPNLPPAVKQDVQQLANSVSAAKSNVDAAQQSIQADVLRQQQQLASAGFKAPSEGWLYVGRVSEDKKTWVEGPKNVHTVAPDPSAGTQVVTSGAAVLRDTSSQPGQRASGNIIAALAPGTTLQVTETDYSHAKSGGNFLWLKVRTL